MSRVVALIDGEHYPPVVRYALGELSMRDDVVAAAFAGGTEKVGPDASDEAYGVPVVHGATAAEALSAAIGLYLPDAVVDLSDEPVVSAEDRFRLASISLLHGVEYRGADFHFSPARPAFVPRTPALAIVGTGKRVGKTAVSAHIARTLKADGREVVVLAMGRGGPAEPEILLGGEVALTTRDLLSFARAGMHAASDNYEDAIMARVTTVGCRRCGGGLAGSVFFSNVPEGARLADGLGSELLVLEGSGAAVPPVASDAVVLVIGAAQGHGYVDDYFGPLRVSKADLVVVTGGDRHTATAVLDAVRTQRPDVALLAVTFLPRPIEDVSGRRVFFATTAPASLLPRLSAHLEAEHGCSVVASSAHLSDRARLVEDMARAAGRYDLLLTELKAAAIDVVAEAGDLAGVPTVLCDNVPVAIEGDLDAELRAAAGLALERGAARGVAQHA